MNFEKPKLILPLEEYRKIMAFTKLAKGEVTGMFEVEYDQDENIFLMKRSYLIKQEAHSAEVEMEGDDLAEFNYQYLSDNPTSKILPRGWWHSHANMDVFFSSTDHATLNNFKNNSYIVGLVVNKKRQMKGILKSFEPFQFEVDDLEVAVQLVHEEIPDELEQEFLEKVDESKRSIVTYASNNYTSYKKDYTDFESTKEVIRRRDKFAMPGVLWLPKSLDEAVERVRAQNLQRIWSHENSMWLYKSDDTGVTYVDKWGVFADFEEELTAVQMQAFFAGIRSDEYNEGYLESVKNNSMDDKSIEEKSIHAMTDEEFSTNHANN